MLVLLVASSALGGRWYEACEVEYWGEPKACEQAPSEPKERPEVPAVPKAKNGPRAYDSDPFVWSAYEDPTDVRFWDDGGDWVPSRPLREVLADPTEENVARYRAWVRQKLELAERGQKLLWGDAPVRGAREVAVLHGEADLDDVVDFGDVRILYFYQSGCGHCRASTSLVHKLEELGAEVHPIYLDEPCPDHPSSVPYTEALASRIDVTGTPTWLVEVNGRRAVLRGRSTLQGIAGAADRLRNP